MTGRRSKRLTINVLRDAAIQCLTSRVWSSILRLMPKHPINRTYVVYRPYCAPSHCVVIAKTNAQAVAKAERRYGGADGTQARLMRPNETIG